MRFLFVSERLETVRGGIERHAAELVAELARRGHDARLVPPDEVRPADLPGVDWLVFDGVRRWTMLRLAPRASRTARIAVFPHASYLEEARAGELRVQRVWRPSAVHYARRAFDRAFAKRTAARFDRLFALCDAEAGDLTRFLAVPSERVSVLPPFVSARFLEEARRAATPSDPVEPYVFAVSRIERRKNLPALVRAVAGSRYRLRIAGQDRGGLVELRASIRATPEARCEYLGEVNEARKVELMRAAAAVVIPSTLEGVPAVAVEALVLGRPVVLAGVAYGPVGPGVLRCAPDTISLRQALERIPGTPSFSPLPAPTVEDAGEKFLAAIAGSRP